MAEMTLEQVYGLVKRLPRKEQETLVAQVQEDLQAVRDYGITVEDIMAEFERRKAAGAFDGLENLEGKYANPNVQVSAEELKRYLQQVGTEWQEDIETLK